MDTSALAPLSKADRVSGPRLDQQSLKPLSAPPAPRLTVGPKSLEPIALVDGDARDDGPAARLLRDTLTDAASRGASDIHIEPGERGWRVRVRIDGLLHEIARPPLYLFDPLVTRIKVLARLDIAERRIPQDGRLRLVRADGLADEYRVNSLPTLFGEKLVLRRLDAEPTRLTLAALGLNLAQQTTLNRALAAPHGMLLVTGPTGSGKTVSLYCFLQLLNSTARNLCAVEDPTEIQLTGVNQVSVREKAGLTFTTALRAFLRQDPDVIMVGEIRDPETADIAVKAAQTGHLVLSTLHTNDAPSAVTRLRDIGVAPFNLAAAIRLISAQRLLRRLCIACRVPAELSRAQWQAAGLADTLIDSGKTIFRARGCDACHGIGYRGRIGIHQVMPVSEAMREIIVAHGSAGALARQARAEGIASLRDAALESVLAGTTSPDEALAATDFVSQENAGPPPSFFDPLGGPGAQRQVWGR